MKRLLAIFALVLCATSAQAFQETEVPVISNDVNSHASGLKTPLSSPDEIEAKNSNEGTVVRIPGFGAVGTLPKLNFGLELLYGDEDLQSPDVQIQDDISIKGRIKHNF